MTKAVIFPLSIVIVFVATAVPAQNSYAPTAENEAVMREADRILLTQRLNEANVAVQQKDLVLAAKLYEDAYGLVLDIGRASIPAEASQTISGLVSVRMELAREADEQGNLNEADTEVLRALKVDPQNQEVIAFKQHIDAQIAQMRGQRPDLATQAEVPAIQNQKTDAATLARDGQMLYEMGKLEEAQAKLEQALQLDPDNRGAYYYLSLTKQAMYARDSRSTSLDNDDRIVRVEKAWAAPVNAVTNFANPYFMTNLVYTGAGRQAIYSKLNEIHLDNVSYQALPLSEVLRDLREKSLLRDPEKQGINFIFNPNIENIPSASATTPGGGPGTGGGEPTAINPATGLPVQAASAPQTADPTQININLNLNNVSLADLLNAICLVADHPIKYSVEDWGVVFSEKGPDAPQYEMRTFKVDPNTFYSGLQNVSSFLFGSVQITSGGAGGGGGSSAAGGANGQSVSGAVVPVVNVSPGAGQARASSGGAGGGGGGAIGTTGGNTGGGTGGAYLQNALGDLNARVEDSGGGLMYVTTPNLTRDVSALAKEFFSSLGVNLDPPKTVFFNDRLGVLFVYATPQDLDIIERAIQVLNQAPPMVHIKARFIDVEQTDNGGLGFQWYLGEFNIGHSVVGQGGNAGSLTVPTSAANPEGVFPGNPTLGTSIANGVQSLTGGLLNESSLYPIGTITGILTNPNFQVVLNALQQRIGTHELAEPEVTTISGRQTEMRATVVQPVVTGYNFQSAPGAVSAGGGVP